jgi:hypothetical protein
MFATIKFHSPKPIDHSLFARMDAATKTEAIDASHFKGILPPSRVLYAHKAATTVMLLFPSAGPNQLEACVEIHAGGGGMAALKRAVKEQVRNLRDFTKTSKVRFDDVSAEISTAARAIQIGRPQGWGAYIRSKFMESTFVPLLAAICTCAAALFVAKRTNADSLVAYITLSGTVAGSAIRLIVDLKNFKGDWSYDDA